MRAASREDRGEAVEAARPGGRLFVFAERGHDVVQKDELFALRRLELGRDVEPLQAFARVAGRAQDLARGGAPDLRVRVARDAVEPRERVVERRLRGFDGSSPRRVRLSGSGPRPRLRPTAAGGNERSREQDERPRESSEAPRPARAEHS